jgi:Flp pilus assembly protein TadG
VLTTRFRRSRRRGVTLVESTLVLMVFLMMMFVLFEYSRFLLVLHITNNATREGARYAVANTDKPFNFDYTDYTDASGTTFTNIQSYTTSRMGGIQGNNIENYQVACFAVDPTGLALTPPVVRPQSTTGAAPFPNPFSNTDPLRVPWNSAPFPQKIAVTINGTYRPIVPTLLFMPSTIPLSVTAVLGSEG